MTDWLTWPIFITQLVIASLLFFPRNKTFFGIALKKIMIGLLLLVAIAIVVSLYHDSTDVLPLYF